MLDDARVQLAELSDLVGDLVQLSRGAPVDEPLEAVDFEAVVVRATDRVRAAPHASPSTADFSRGGWTAAPRCWNEPSPTSSGTR